MFCWKVFLLIIFASLTYAVNDKNYVTANTPSGGIRGTVMNSRKNRNYYAFRGIRYAQPPIGERRFHAPIPIESWNGTLDATTDGYICAQYLPVLNESLISEDCLFLNVYTKDLSGSLPVMVYIYGGAFESGGSHSEIFWGPQYLMDKDVVFVTFNYRLGPLGFLSTGTKDAPGNYGLKDQTMALRWVQDNIKSFGGDPSTVTLWGHSSGSMCVTLHMVSPMSQGLFHRIIAMSGSTTSHVVPRNQEVTKRLALELGCYSSSPKLLVECLRYIPYDRIVAGTISWNIPDLSQTWWNYEIEADHGQERFMIEDPTTLYARGKFYKIPILAGITKDEFRGNAYKIYNNSKLMGEFNNNFNSIAPRAFMYSPELVNVSRVLRSAYLNNEEITRENLDKFGQLYSDALFVHGVHRFVSLTRKYTWVFYYRQDFVGRYSWIYEADGKPIGVYHADDLLYLLVHTETAPIFKETDPENVMVERLTELWTTFAKTGNPNNHTNPWTCDIDWKPSNNTTLNMIRISETSYTSDESNQDYLKLWDNLFPISFE